MIYGKNYYRGLLQKHSQALCFEPLIYIIYIIYAQNVILGLKRIACDGISIVAKTKSIPFRVRYAIFD